ncbi:MAG: transporter substrate-binding domain-containing protein [Pseudomonadota bacterium]|nr:transporter substrate-binding domain-containing protein [Pseudomonadota bacterium]
MKFRLISLCLTFFSVSVIAAELAPAPTYGAVKLRTTIWPPYQMMLQGELSGESTETLRCIFRDINESFSVQVMPWQRAIQDIKHSVADGIFTSGPSPELDKVATMSAPFALEKWYWYHARPIDLKDPKSLRIGAVRSSNQATWLDSEGIPVTELVNEGMQLVRLVQAGRIDTFIADSRYFEELVSEASDFNSYLDKTFVRYMPLGVYFANQFLEQHPEFIGRFNKQISDCAGETIALNDMERENLLSVVTKRIRTIIDDNKLLAALDDSNQMQRALAADVIDALDVQWRHEVSAAEQPLISEIISRPTSAYLRSVKELSNGLITEAILVGSAGLNAAQSDITTDYYQADEAAWKALISNPSSEYHIDGIRYDGSSRKFQVKVSWTIEDSRGERKGILILGIDVEEALRNSH